MAETDVVDARAYKRKPVMDVESDLAFVAQQGNPVEQARLKYLLAHEAPSPAVVSRLLAGQRDDGG